MFKGSIPTKSVHQQIIACSLNSNFYLWWFFLVLYFSFMRWKWFVFANCETSDKFARIYSSLILTNFVYFVMFRYFRNEQRTVPDMCPAIVLNLGLLLGTCQLANGQIFSPLPKNNPRSLCEGYLGPVAFAF